MAPPTTDSDLYGFDRLSSREDPFETSFMDEVDALTTERPTVGCVIPAYNEAGSIADVLESLLAQTRLPDVIHVVINNTTDDTVAIASEFAGPHMRNIKGVEQFTEVYVHDIGKNKDKKVGALNYGYTLVEGCDYFLGVDGDTVADPRAIEYLEQEIVSDSRIGGISAIYSIDETPFTGFAAFLITGQRAQFAAFNMQNMLRGRNMAVLGGQFSIFSTRALRKVMEDNNQGTPWVNDSEVEDSLLSLQIKSAGFLTKISAQARADVGGMTSLRSLHGQQVKWNYGAIDLLWPGQRGDTKGQPFHPNLRLRWLENFSMLMNGATRLLFIVLLAASMSFHAYVFFWFWILPTVFSVLLNLKTALSMKNRSSRDILFALLWFPAELYMWIRLAHFFSAWSKFFSRQKVDNWAAQAKAERGSGHSYLVPFIVLGLAIIALMFGWFQLDVAWKSYLLAIAWPILGVITGTQTVFMVLKLFRRYRGYKV
ncbi:MAG: glycosyltransferase [Microbacteriaceae bacterium]